MVHELQCSMLLQAWSKYKKAAINPTDPHWVLSGSLLTGLLAEDLTVIAEGSLLNKVYPSKKDYHSTLRFGFQQWTKHNGLPSMPSNLIWTLLILYGNNTSKRPPVISRKHPSQNSNACLPMLSFTVKTRRRPHCGSSVRASTSKRSKPLSWMHQSLKHPTRTP